jgi:hypothetical protein
MSSSKKIEKLTCKGTLRQVFIRVYRLEIQSFMLVSSTYSFVNYYTSNLLSVSPPLLPWVKVQYIQTMCGWRGTALSPVVRHCTAFATGTQLYRLFFYIMEMFESLIK